jgi:hypothetical protein
LKILYIVDSFYIVHTRRIWWLNKLGNKDKVNRLVRRFAVSEMELEYASGISLDLISEGNSVVKWFDDWAK